MTTREKHHELLRRVERLEREVKELRAVEVERRRKAGPQRIEDSFTEARLIGDWVWHMPHYPGFPV